MTQHLATSICVIRRVANGDHWCDTHGAWVTDPASEYGRLLAERDRLIAEGVDPSELLVPDPPPGDRS